MAVSKAMTPIRGRTRQKVGRHLYRLGSALVLLPREVVVAGDIATAMADCSLGTFSMALLCIKDIGFTN
jgi:hypothetical protein